MSNIQIPSLKDRPVLQQGSQESAWVVCLQNMLNGCGYEHLELDGDFGTHTTKVVKKFQRDLGLKDDGVVGEKSWEALDKHEKSPDYKPMYPMTGIAGVDTVPGVSSDMIAKATKFLKRRPKFWGRYFLGGDGEYRHKEENNVLRDAEIRVLPICRETNRIRGSKDDGFDVGRRVVDDVLETFGEDYLTSQGDSFYIFLDTEPLPNPVLSADYYLGWSKAVAEGSSKVKLLPCVYLNGGDKKTAIALSEAMDVGAMCYGLWIARYYNHSHVNDWFLNQDTPATKVPCPVLIHQYVGDVREDGTIAQNGNGTYDFNQINPFFDDPNLNPNLVLKRLILPQKV